MTAAADRARWSANLQAEVDGEFVYRAMAANAGDPRLAELYAVMAAAEGRHAQLWRDRLATAAMRVDPRPSGRARILGFVARRFGAGMVARLSRGHSAADPRDLRPCLPRPSLATLRRNSIDGSERPGPHRTRRPDMKILVTTASKHGATAEIGDAIAGKLREHDLEVEVHEPGDVTSLDGYDAVILGSAIYAGRWMDSARRFSEHHHQALRQLPVWLFSSGPIGDPLEPAEEPVDGHRLLGELEAREHRTFPGRVHSSELGWVEATITKMVRAPDGDFRDFDAIRIWAAEIADQLAPATAAR